MPKVTINVLFIYLFIYLTFANLDNTNIVRTHDCRTTMQNSCTYGSPLKHTNTNSSVFTCIGALGTPSRTGPLAYRVSLTVGLCEGNKIISLKNLFHHSQLGALKKKKPRALGTCPLPSVPIG